MYHSPVSYAGHPFNGRHLQRGFWRASKRWCKGMSEDAVNKALLRFANNGAPHIATSESICFTSEQPLMMNPTQQSPSPTPMSTAHPTTCWQQQASFELTTHSSSLPEIDPAGAGCTRMLLMRPGHAAAEAGLTPKDIYGGPRGAIAQLAGLAEWFAHQREFCFYSSSVLIIYEGAASSAETAAVSIRLVTWLCNQCLHVCIHAATTAAPHSCVCIQCTGCPI
jgi:Inositol polyphosphate kinase